MTNQLTYANLAPHRKLPLSEQEREDLPVVEWQAYTAPRYLHLRSVNTLGEWFIGHPMANSHGHEPVEIGYQMPLDEGEDFADLVKHTKELNFDQPKSFETWAKMSKQDIGYAFDQEYAKVFVEKALRQAPGQDPEKILEAGGFTFEHEMASREEGGSPTRVFRKSDAKRGFFSVMLSAHSLWLMHEKRGSTSWENLLRVATVTQGASGNIIPRFISPHVDNIIATAAEMSCHFAMEWTPTPRRSKRSSPK